ncbi:MAG: hypothetical protein RHS_2973 [Robinsoniella sp. RHS]|nr:MAG: hypothetical protein RHS_2973 [Robinsoniella sp. RHS]
MGMENAQSTFLGLPLVKSLIKSIASLFSLLLCIIFLFIYM